MNDSVLPWASKSPAEQLASIQEFVAESHHRVSNSFQNLVSFLNIRFRDSLPLDAQALQVLVSYVGSLAALHEMVATSVLKNRRLDQVDADVLIERIVESWRTKRPQVQIDLNTEPISLPPKMALALATVANELLAHALSLHARSIVIEITVENNAAKLSLIIAADPPPDKEVEAIGLGLARMLAEKELAATLLLDAEKDSRQCMQLVFTLPEQNPSVTQAQQRKG